MIRKIKAFIFSEAFRYLFFGVLTTAVNFLCFTVFYEAVGLDINISNFLGIAISILFAFFTNKFYVFESRKAGFWAIFLEFLRFISSRVGTMLLELAGVWLLSDILFLNAYFSKIVMQVFVIIGNYFLSKFFIFKGNSK